MPLIGRHPGILNRERAVLVVIDVQERFAPAIPALKEALPRMALLAKVARRLALPVVWSEQYPKGLGPTLPALAEALAAPGELEPPAPLAKTAFSLVLDEACRRAVETTGRDQALLCGLEAHVCVAQSALDLMAHGFQVHVAADAAVSRRESDARAALARLARAGCILTTAEAAVFELLERAGTEEFREVQGWLKRV